MVATNLYGLLSLHVPPEKNHRKQFENNSSFNASNIGWSLVKIFIANLHLIKILWSLWMGGLKNTKVIKDPSYYPPFRGFNEMDSLSMKNTSIWAIHIKQPNIFVYKSLVTTYATVILQDITLEGRVGKLADPKQILVLMHCLFCFTMFHPREISGVCAPNVKQLLFQGCVEQKTRREDKEKTQ